MEQKEGGNMLETEVCKICNGDGYLRASVPYGDPNFGKALPCECHKAKQKAREQQALLFASGILDMMRFKDASFGSFDLSSAGTREAYREAEAYARNPRGWLVLTGPYGCGKTHLAVSIAKVCVGAGQTVLIQTVPDLLDYLRETFKPSSGQTYNDRFESMKKADLLILDDYGAQSDTMWATEKLFQLLNYRYNMGASTVLTSNNVDLEGIDPRVFSRLHDNGLVTLVKMSRATDYRPRMQREEVSE